MRKTKVNNLRKAIYIRNIWMQSYNGSRFNYNFIILKELFEEFIAELRFNTLL